MQSQQEPPGQEITNPKKTGQQESFVPRAADKIVKLGFPKAKPGQSASATSIAKNRRKVEVLPASTPAKSTAESPSGAREKSVAEPVRHDSSKSEVKAQAHPAETLSGPATVFQCVDLICAQSVDQARLPRPHSPKTEESKGTRVSVAGDKETSSQDSALSRSKADLRDATPRYQSNPLPEYPYLARQRHWEGEVWLLVTVSAHGRVEDLEVATSSGYGALDKAALNSVRRWRFSPAEKAGIPVASRVKVPVRFQLQH